MKNTLFRRPIPAAAFLMSLLTVGCAQDYFVEESSAASFGSAIQTEAETETETDTETTAHTSPKTVRKTAKTSKKTETAKNTTTADTTVSTVKVTGLIASADEFDIYDLDGEGWDFEFEYGGRLFEAQYTYEPENWKIIDSYMIKDHGDMLIICEALSDIHPIHGSDYESFRTAEDMVYEWEQHNLAYSILPGSSQWKDSARDVDLDPEDQGKSMYELFKARTGIDLF